MPPVEIGMSTDRLRYPLVAAGFDGVYRVRPRGILLLTKVAEDLRVAGLLDWAGGEVGLHDYAIIAN